MKVCIFTTTIDKKDGGPSRSVPILAKGLACIGVDITLVTCSSENMNTHLIAGSSIKLEVISKDISYKQLEEVLLGGKYDLIHGQNLWVPLYHKMAKIARKYKIPYMMTPRGCLEPWCLAQKNIKKRIALLLYQKRDLNRASCILATSKMEVENIKLLGITSPIALIPNGIDISEYRCRTLKHKGNIKKQICFISRIHEKKGIEFLINAWEVLNIKYPDWSIVIAGNGEDEYIYELKQLVITKKLNDCIKIIPPVFGEEKYKLYSESSLFVLPTYSENFGMVIAEAMSCGVPVITTTGTPWAFLNDCNLGWSIELDLNNLILALSKAIELGCDNLFQMGQKCSKYISDTFQYIEVAKKNKATYEWIVNQNPKPNFVE